MLNAGPSANTLFKLLPATARCACSTVMCLNETSAYTGAGVIAIAMMIAVRNSLISISYLAALIFKLNYPPRLLPRLENQISDVLARLQRNQMGHACRNDCHVARVQSN